MTGAALFGLFGAGGHAREVMPFLAESLRHSLPGMGVEVCFVDLAPAQTHVNGHRVMSEAAFFAAEHPRKFFNVAVGDSRLREKIARACAARDVQPLTVTAPGALIYDGNEIGTGGLFCAFSMVTSNSRIGRFFQGNIYSYVAHDCVIGDFVTFAPGVKCNGNVHIGDHAYIGTGAMLRDGRPVDPLGYLGR